MSDLVVSTSRLTKRYGGDGGVLAVDNVDLSVPRGEIYGFLGLNGAGKSTTIRMLLGMIRPTSGHAELFGVRVEPDATPLWRRVGHLVETAVAYPELSVRENLDIARKLAGVTTPRATDAQIERLNLGQYADRRARALSLGNLQRLALARALIGQPELLILDEPANGLDPAGVIEIRDLLRELTADRRVTVLMSSHILGEVDRLATRVGIIHEGRLIEELDSGRLERHREQTLHIAARDVEAARAALMDHGFASELIADDGREPYLKVRDTRAVESPDGVARLMVGAGVAPTHLALARESLEEHFMRLTGAAGDGR